MDDQVSAKWDLANKTAIRLVDEFGGRAYKASHQLLAVAVDHGDQDAIEAIRLAQKMLVARGYYQP